jgi:hypothetical protein
MRAMERAAAETEGCRQVVVQVVMAERLGRALLARWGEALRGVLAVNPETE